MEHLQEKTNLRYLDLRKAEAQTREAKIESTLERIRTSALAMHSSNDLGKVAKVLRQQMALLDQPELESCLVQLYEKDEEYYTTYYSFREQHKMSTDLPK